jgi:hypothetical protein
MAKRSRAEAALNRAVSVKAAKDGMVAALNAHGKEIAARIQIADKALAELKDKAGSALKTFVDHRHAIAKMLADAKDECKAAKVPFEEFRKKYAPNFQRSLTYELVAIGQGKLTLEDRTAAATKRKQKSRANARVLSAAVEAAKAREVPAAKPTDPDLKPLDDFDKANAALRAKLATEPVAEPGIPEPPEEPLPTTPAAATLVPALDLMPETLEQCLDRMVAKVEEKGGFPAFNVCMACVAYLAPMMNEGTRAQLRKSVTNITMQVDKSAQKAA